MFPCRAVVTTLFRSVGSRQTNGGMMDTMDGDVQRLAQQRVWSPDEGQRIVAAWRRRDESLAAFERRYVIAVHRLYSRITTTDARGASCCTSPYVATIAPPLARGEPHRAKEDRSRSTAWKHRKSGRVPRVASATYGELWGGHRGGRHQPESVARFIGTSVDTQIRPPLDT